MSTLIHSAPADRLYDSELDMWIRMEGGLAVVGATAFGAEQAGEFLIFTPKRPGWEALRGKSLGLVETGKTVLAVRAPLSGRIVEANAAVEATPRLINADPYDAGWLFKLQPLALEQERAELIDGETYRERVVRRTLGTDRADE